MSLIQFLVVLRARYRVVLIAMVATCALALAAGFAMPKRYTAETQLFFDLLAGDVVGGSGAPLSANSSSSYLPTQIEIMTSEAVALKVVLVLHLDQDPARHAAWLKSTHGRGSEAGWLADSLLKQLVARPKMDSNIVTLSFRSNDATFSAEAVNAFAASYLQAVIEMRNGPARETAKWLEGRVADAQASLDAAQQKVVAYQRANGIVTTDEHIDTDTGRLAMLAQQLVALQGQNADLRSKLQVGQAGGVANSFQDGVGARLRGDIAELQAKMSETATNLGTRNPAYLQMQARLASLQAQRAAEQSRAAGTVRADSSVGKLREAQADASMSTQTRRAVEAATRRAELQSLVQLRDNAQGQLRDLSQKYAQASLLMNSVQTNVSIMARAPEPLVPSSPSPVLCALLGLIMGTLIGVVAAFAFELLDRRVRSDDDITDLLAAPVLGARRSALPSPFSRVLSWSNA